MDITFNGELWEWQGQGAWCFVSLPQEYYQDIKSTAGPQKRGFGSIRVEAVIGRTAWKTSIFPDSKTSTYLLPVKKQVRKIEQLEIGTTISVTVRLTEF